MPYDYSLARRTKAEQIRCILAKLTGSCFTVADRKFSLGGIAEVRYMSRGAVGCLKQMPDGNSLARKLAGGVKRHKLFVFDHCIPVREALLQLEREPTEARVGEAVTRGGMCYAILLKSEDCRMTAAGYQRKMPDGWDGSICEDATEMRATAAGIELVGIDEALREIETCQSKPVHQT